MTVEGLLDEMDVYLRLATGGDTMKQGDVLFKKRELYLVVGLLLGRTEGFDILRMGLTAMVQASHFLLVSFQESTLAEGRDRGEGMALVQEFVTSDLTPLSSLHTSRDIEEIDKGFLLGRGALEHVESEMKGLFVTEFRGETNIEFRFRTIAVFGF
jgi:hypothetical protein